MNMLVWGKAVGMASVSAKEMLTAKQIAERHRLVSLLAKAKPRLRMFSNGYTPDGPVKTYWQCTGDGRSSTGLTAASAYKNWSFLGCPVKGKSDERIYRQ